MKIKIFFLVILSFFLLLFLFFYKNNFSHKQFLIYAEKKSENIILKKQIGTAFSMDKNTLITSFHTIKNMDEIYFLDQENKKNYIFIAQINKEKDIAYLIENTKSFKIKENKNLKNIKAGEKIYYFDLKGKKINGKILETKDDNFWFTDFVFKKSESGSPIFLEKNNKIIGIAQSVNYEEKISKISKF